VTKVFLNLTEVFLTLTEVFLALTEVFPCFFLSCKANARVKLAKTGHGSHSTTFVCICVVRMLFVLFYVVFVCKCVLPPGDNPTAVNKKILHSFCLMVEASNHGYVLHTRHIHVTRYNVVCVSYIFFFRTSNYVQQRKTYTRKAATVHLNCSTVPCKTLCERIAAAVPCNTLCARIAAAV
jgi:hypothetical protein